MLDPESEIPENRFNDAKVNAEGRIWPGSTDDLEVNPKGWLYRKDADRSFSK